MHSKEAILDSSNVGMSPTSWTTSLRGKMYGYVYTYSPFFPRGVYYQLEGSDRQLLTNGDSPPTRQKRCPIARIQDFASSSLGFLAWLFSEPNTYYWTSCIITLVVEILCLNAFAISWRRDSAYEGETFRYGYLGTLAFLILIAHGTLLRYSGKSALTSSGHITSCCFLITFHLFFVFALRLTTIPGAASCQRNDERCGTITAITWLGFTPSCILLVAARVTYLATANAQGTEVVPILARSPTVEALNIAETGTVKPEDQADLIENEKALRVIEPLE